MIEFSRIAITAVLVFGGVSALTKKHPTAGGWLIFAGIAYAFTISGLL